jgi:hypothetical protein
MKNRVNPEAIVTIPNREKALNSRLLKLSRPA